MITHLGMLPSSSVSREAASPCPSPAPPQSGTAEREGAGSPGIQSICQARPSSHILDHRQSSSPFLEVYLSMGKIISIPPQIQLASGGCRSCRWHYRYFRFLLAAYSTVFSSPSLSPVLIPLFPSTVWRCWWWRDSSTPSALDWLQRKVAHPLASVNQLSLTCYKHFAYSPLFYFLWLWDQEREGRVERTHRFNLWFQETKCKFSNVLLWNFVVIFFLAVESMGVLHNETSGSKGSTTPCISQDNFITP